MASDRTIFDEPHHQSLELLAVQALARGDAATAFRLADRRCRISPQPDPHSYVLRGDALVQLEDTPAALSDVASALAIAPDDIAACRRMLAWGDGAPQKRAAAALIGRDRDVAVLRRAIEVLRGDGQQAFASVAVLDDVIEGWAAWEDDVPLAVTILDDTDSATTRLEPDRSHALGDIGRALSFRLSRPESSKPQSILLSVADRVFHSMRMPGRGPAAPLSRPRVDRARAGGATVVVPVYGDYDATRACLESLLDELSTGSFHRAIVVDDATPDPRIAGYLASVSLEPCIDLLTNARNLGFVGAVNRALRETTDGDVLLLNADTIVPPGFIDRLAAVARSSPDIGTVMPLSNNGDLAGFPVPHVAGPLGSLDDVERIDRIAAKVNAGRVIDIPNGVGFCLYITRACLDAVGLLSEDYDRGYLEDVDFCLRARERGFRNVCAPSVYVGHAGSKSFGAEKRSLVARNQDILLCRYPGYRFEFGAFDLADPLRACRAAIEREAHPPTDEPRLLITGAGVVGAIARERARRLAAEGQAALILEVRHRAGGPRVHMTEPSGGVPQSIAFDLASPADCASLLAYARKMQPSRIEIFDPTNVPFQLVDLLRGLQVPYDLVVADAGQLGRRGVAGLLAAARYLGDGGGDTPDDDVWVQRWREIADGAEKILAADAPARAFAANLFADRRIDRPEAPGRTRGRAPPRSDKRAPGCRLGLIPVRIGAREQWLMREIACAFRKARPDLALIVIGATLDDIGLMRIGNTHVTGAVDPGELDQVARSYDLDAVFASVTQPLFGHPLVAAAFSSPHPFAYFDWSKGRVPAAEGDLPLDPGLSLKALVAALARWMPDR